MLGPPTFLGKYELVERLGHGGMATVYLARGTGPAGFRRLVAVKTIHEHLADEGDFVRMFLDEARLAARVHHPHAVSVYEVGSDRGRHFIAMEYVHGETFFALLAKAQQAGTPFPVSLALAVLEGIGDALHSAHELTSSDGFSLGVVHRDVTPHNILIGYDGVSRIADFGVAEAADRVTKTEPGLVRGKPGYMAPEQFRSEPVDRRVDVFSMGIVLWEALAGRRLFKRATNSETIRALHNEAVPPLSSLRPDIPTDVDSIAGRALAFRPEDRFATARQMAEALRTVALSEGLVAQRTDIERYMKTVFSDEFAHRQTVVHQALHDEATPRIAASRGEKTKMLPPPDPSVGSARPATPPVVFALAMVASIAVFLLTTYYVQATWATPVIVRTATTEESIVAVPTPSEREVPSSADTPIAPSMAPAGRTEGSKEDRGAHQAPSVKPPEPRKRTLVFRVVPANATVFVNGRRVQRRIRRMSSTVALSVRVTSPGYEAKALQVVPDRDRVIKVVLAKSRPAKSPQRPEPQGPLLLSGDDL